jgi:anti-sigma regulatory factor (Ser/Thr protein kinase)
MDWYLDGAKPEAVTTLRHELRAYLARHAEPGSDLDAAELVTSEAVGNAVRHAAGPVWVSLSRARVVPRRPAGQ